MFTTYRPYTAMLIGSLLAAYSLQPHVVRAANGWRDAQVASARFDAHLRALEDKLELALAAPDDTYPVTQIECEGIYWRPNESIVCRSNGPTLVNRVGEHGHMTFPLGVYFPELNAVVIASGVPQTIRRHEERHRQQATVPIETAADSIMLGTYYEADARLDEIITAYQIFLRVGDRTAWDDLRARDPEMLAVFDGLVRDDPAAREALRQGRDPSVEIMRATALSYVFTQTARHYVTQSYYPDLGQPRRPEVPATDDLPPDWQDTVDAYFSANDTFHTRVIEASSITISPTTLAQALARDGVPYLYDPNMPQTNPLNRDLYGYLTQTSFRAESEWQMAHAAGSGCVRWQRPHDPEVAETLVVRHPSSDGLRPRQCDGAWVSREGLALQSAGLGNNLDGFFTPPELGDHPLGMTSAQARALRPYGLRLVEQAIAAARLYR